ncbi:SRPBCC family protein [uncultured Marinobacter sp.]|uniref:SRPBCC family protein n=1 Tax=uncultured Marinobacter sp. TaxID=187379 RepID=UPI0030DC5A34
MPAYKAELIDILPASRDRVFDHLADHNRLGSLIGLPVRRIRDSDQADPNGTGSVRWIGLGPVGFEETILTFEPERLIEYTVTSLSGFRNHHGRVRLSDTTEGHTRLHYTIEFDEVIPFTGNSLQRALERILRRGARRLRDRLR